MKSLNNNIQESYCSFEVSKLLKEKGFDGKRNCDFGYTITGVSSHDISIDIANGVGIYKPTHALAIEWIRVNFGVLIYIHISGLDNGRIVFASNIKRIFGNLNNYPLSTQNYTTVYEVGTRKPLSFKSLNSPQQATEAALLYCLKNLI